MYAVMANWFYTLVAVRK